MLHVPSTKMLQSSDIFNKLIKNVFYHEFVDFHTLDKFIGLSRGKTKHKMESTLSQLNLCKVRLDLLHTSDDHQQHNILKL